MNPPPATTAVASLLVKVLQFQPADVSMSAPSLKGPPAAVTLFDVEDEGERNEPLAKRQKLSTRRVGDEEFCHMDIQPYEHIDKQIDGESFENCGLTTKVKFLDWTTTTIWHVRTEVPHKWCQCGCPSVNSNRSCLQMN